MPHLQHAVERKGNRLSIPTLGSPFIVGNLIRALYQGAERGYTDFTLDFANVDAAYPNACVPVAGILDFYRSQRSTTFDTENSSDYLTHTKTLSPTIVGAEPSHKTSPLNTVWKFSSADEVHSLVTAYLDAVTRAAECQDGVLQGLEWCLNEIMDNVLQHADTTHGYAMAQIHSGSQHIAICIYDHGRGIYNSLRNSHHAPANAVDAITIALQEGVTRDKNVGQGNGMWGLHNIVKANSGLLNVTSGAGFFDLSDDAPKTSSSVPFLSRDNNCTTVDFQIDIGKGISISDALGGYEPANLRLENLEDDHENIVFPLADKASGTGTRHSGQALRNEIVNIINQTDAMVVIDFDRLSVVSSSFADELIGKLAVKIGFISFNQKCRLVGMNETVQAIVNRSVQQRLAVGPETDGDEAAEQSDEHGTAEQP